MSTLASRIDQKTNPVTQPVPAAARPAPGPGGLGLARTFFRMRKDALATLQELIDRYGDAVLLPMGRLTFLLLNHPDQVSHVLQTNAKAYCKSKSYREMELILGKGLVTSEGSLWRKQRRLVQPHFHRTEVARFAPMVVRLTRELLADWQRTGTAARDALTDSMHLTLRIAGLSLFSTELGSASDELGKALEVVIPVVHHRTEALFNFPMHWPLPTHLRFHRAKQSMDRVIDGMIRSRLEGGSSPRQDMLTALLAARDPETGEPMPPQQVRDEVMTFLLAGHETTANALAWTLHLVARHQDVQARLLDEARTVLDGRDPGADDLPRLEYTRRVLLESLRLYPPAWLFEREAIEDDQIGSVSIPKGTTVMLCPYTTHRHSAFWTEPERFDPDRFLPQQVADRARGAYYPFGAGQRQCIGEAFAMMELELILPMLLQAFRLQPAPDASARTDPRVTLRPRDGIRILPTARH